MLQLTPGFRNNLLETLLKIPALSNPDNRNLLLLNLPPSPVSAINRSNTFIADLHNIISAVEGWGQLNSGEWALVVLTKNALQYFAKGTELGRDLETLLGELETMTFVGIPLLEPLEVPIEEVLVWQQDERLPTHFLERGLAASRAVAKVIVPCVLNGVPSLDKGNGSGWLITPDLLLTNYHVIQARNKNELPANTADFKAQALKATVWFNYTDWNVDYSEYKCIELVHFSVEFDYALLRLSPSSSSSCNQLLSSWGYLSVIQSKPELLKGSRLNIIQHPQGGPQRIAIRSNFYVDYINTTTSPERIRYLTDTEPGSSGSPVFNDEWQVVALHHSAIKVPEANYKGEVVKYNNQGILINAILDNLPTATRQEIQEAQENLLR
ncbi:serine protease [Nostoc sp. UHCC 0252]|uniref:trypsin-like serine peptidase n=1 Tax=Nostoc sp. UHCC 0252 TaxID=3110241 RepID=UPI002B1F42E5|nr:serine protease [Nostoc sp. UHCC 0252]MEA5604809.1 serine protease [Nostoc sp. UHCC 0252]